MHYHPEEMGFGGPDVCFEWNEMGWIMEFIPPKSYPGRETNIDTSFFGYETGGISGFVPSI